MIVLQVCAFAAPSGGNFIASLTHLEHKLAEKGIKTIYAFANGAKDRPWCQDIQKRTKVYFLPTARARILPDTYKIFSQIYHENKIDILHSHFELYDIPATVTAPSNVKIFWHLHDPITVNNDLRGVLWKIQYGVVGKRVQLLSVSDYYKELVIRLGFPRKQTRTILNCIDTSRIKYHPRQLNARYDFLTFGWDFYRKGDDVILQACDKLYREGYKFKLLLNGNKNTWKILDEYSDNYDRPYLIKGNQVNDVNELFSNSKLFIQASRKETFSYAVCEAAYAGLPVICSDIKGLEWAHEIPLVVFFENENVEMLYRCMKESLIRIKDKDTVIKSRSIIENKYSINTWINNIISAYGIN